MKISNLKFKIFPPLLLNFKRHRHFNLTLNCRRGAVQRRQRRDPSRAVINSGFTLVELIITVAIFSMIVVGLFALVSFILGQTTRQNKVLTNNEQATKAAFTIIKELRNAKTSATASYPIATASDQTLIFYSDAGVTVDRINYFIQGGVLKKGVTKPTGTLPTYNLGQEVVTTVQNDLANGATPLFYYYGDTYSGTGAALVQPVNVTAVRFIKVNFKIYNKGGIVGNTNSYTVTAGGSLRSLKTNLGN